MSSRDWVTWIPLGILMAFWVADGIVMILRRRTVSKLIGQWEAHHLARRLIVGGLLLFLLAHLEFFP